MARWGRSRVDLAWEKIGGRTVIEHGPPKNMANPNHVRDYQNLREPTLTEPKSIVIVRSTCLTWEFKPVLAHFQFLHAKIKIGLSKRISTEYLLQSLTDVSQY